MKLLKSTIGSDLAIGFLSFATLTLSFFSYNEYTQNKKNQVAIENEKKIIDHQFTEIINSLDNVKSENELINEELITAKGKIISLQDSLRLVSTDVSSILKFKEQLIIVAQDKKRLIALVDSLDTQNKELLVALDIRDSELLDQKKFNEALQQKNNRLETNIKKASKVVATAFKADGIRIRSNGKIVTETKYRRVDKVRVCFTMSENLFAQSGEKEIYVQILSPNNNIIGDKLDANFKGSKKVLTYSTKTTIDYDNKAIDLCLFIDADKKELKKGTYFINVFEGQTKIGDTQLILK